MRTREDMINRMGEALLDNMIIIRNRHTIGEMRDFGRFEGEIKAAGIDNNDDAAIANCINICALHQSGKRQEWAESAGLAGEGSRHAHLLPKTPQLFSIHNQFGQAIPLHETITSMEMGNKLISTMSKKYGIDLSKQWRVVPIMVSRANTIWSPVFDSTGAEHELASIHNYPGQEQMKNPDTVSAYRKLLHMQAKFGVQEVSEMEFGDED